MGLEWHEDEQFSFLSELDFKGELDFKRYISTFKTWLSWIGGG